MIMLLRASIRVRLLPYGLTVLLLAMGVSSILLLLTSEAALRQQFLRDAVGVDLVVGARGSPLQLVLSSVYQMDVPTGNIAIADAEALCRHPHIAVCVPLALGDNYQGFRIVGLELGVRNWGFGLDASTRAALGDDGFPLQPLQALIGSDVARQTQLRVGSRFVGSHGLAGDGHKHEALPYTVVGILPRTHTVQDRLILTPVESVHKIHAHEGGAASTDITALLIQLKSPRSAITLPRWIHAHTPLQAAHPATEITRLFALLGGGLDGLRALSTALIAAAILSLFISLYTSLASRLPDLAMLRVLGWTKPQLAALMLAEGMLITLCGLLLGMILALGALPWFASLIGLPLITPSPAAMASASVGMVMLGVLGGAVLSCLLPVWRVYRMNVPQALLRG